ncbi:MAG: ATP-binding protein [Armatimonadetes bacterium]|nr:ATP-binding protein [Armatimonadota bacterium]
MQELIERYIKPGVIGKVVATESRPATAAEFYFWTRSDNIDIEIGSIVAAVSHEGITFGVLDEPQRYTDLRSFMDDYVAHDFGQVEVRAPSALAEILVFKAKVLRTKLRNGAERMRPTPPGDVFFPTREGIEFAMFAEKIDEGRRIPAGLFSNSDGSTTPVYIDEEFLLGMEGAHLNITGVSGLATKTSYIEFLLRSLFTFSRRRIAVVCFNVKGPDLLFLDHPNRPADPELQQLYRLSGIKMMSDEDLRRYGALHLPPEPFEQVRIFAPYKSDGFTLNSARSHPDARANVRPFTWGLKDIVGDVHSLLGRDDMDEKADAFMAYIREAWIDANVTCSFEELEAKLAQVIEETEGSGKDTYHSHHIATIRKMRNRLTNIPMRCPGLISRGRVPEGSDIPLHAMENRDIFVVDVAGLNTRAQELVFHKVIGRLGQLKERDEMKVEHVIVFVDELNKFAPRLGQSLLKQTLIEISARGRYIGFVLFGAQQFRSKVDDEVVGNTATSLYGRMDAEELTAPAYRVFSETVKDKLSALDKGELLLRHPHFKQPVFVRFPMPTVLRGKDGLSLWPARQDDPALRISQTLKEIDPSTTVEMEELRRMVDGLGEATIDQILDRVRRRYDPRRTGFLWALFKTELRNVTGRERD